jgi:hypothetical protein
MAAYTAGYSGNGQAGAGPTDGMKIGALAIGGLKVAKMLPIVVQLGG